ncbi:hypothetical protein J437_LFUL002918 [Ladona fulva]|uniref:Protein quiver n=1 Tax=Ladona fulva TaxID=123851 RepID=A0A8K0P2R5_LADFU|nr:hypothetical protein J437_LFUL002918 [Ladona fulva]
MAGTSLPRLHPILLYVVILSGTLVSKGRAEIECYVCSFNPYEVLPHPRENYTIEPEWWQLDNDTCSWERFDPTRTRTTICDRGCEIVKMTDGNGELEMLYRNCLTRPEVTYEFVKSRNKMNEEEVFTCDSRLCNGSIIYEISLPIAYETPATQLSS